MRLQIALFVNLQSLRIKFVEVASSHCQSVAKLHQLGWDPFDLLGPVRTSEIAVPTATHQHAVNQQRALNSSPMFVESPKALSVGFSYSH